MSYKNAANTTIIRDILSFEKGTGNIYESLVVLSKRANHISSEMREELLNKLKEFSSSTDNLEEVFENREQIEISKFYEKLPKSTLIALQEYLDDKIYYRNPEKD
jgi:DNA-directed RNA polymerase subunit K/omega